MISTSLVRKTYPSSSLGYLFKEAWIKGEFNLIIKHPVEMSRNWNQGQAKKWNGAWETNKCLGSFAILASKRDFIFIFY